MKKFLTVFVILFCTYLSAMADCVTKTKLPNGHTVIVKEMHANPIVMVDTWVKTGSIDEADDNNGVAHFLEHLFFKGSKNYPNNDFDMILESKGASTNAATSKDYTHFHIIIPSKDFETAVKLHADMLARPLFPKDEIDKERQVVIREIERSNDNPSRRLYNAFNKALYPTHPYRREVLGKKEIIASIPREKIFDFYSKHYSPQNLITVIAGDVNSKDAVELVKQNFANSYVSSKPVKNKHSQDKIPEQPIFVNTKEDVGTSSMIIGYKCGLKFSDKDSYALDLLSIILGQGKSSRFYKEIKDKKQLAQIISANNLSMKEDSVFVINASLHQDDIEKTKYAIFSEIENVKNNGVSEEELARAKKMTERSTLYSRESVEDNTSEIGYSTLLTDNWDFYDEYLENMKKITAKDIQKAAKKYLNAENTVIAIQTPKVYKEKNQQTSADNNVILETEKVTSACFVPAKHSPVKTEKSGKLVKYTLDNGAVLLVDNQNANDIVSVDIKIKGGNYINKNSALSKLVASLITKNTKKYPKSVFADIADENGIKISADNNTEYFNVTLKCVKQDLPLAMDMLMEVLNNAVFNDDDIERNKAEILHRIHQNRDNVSNVVFEEFIHEFWKNTPYDTSGFVVEKDMQAVTKDDIYNLYKKIFDSQNAVIAICGNVNEKEMINYFSEMIKPHSDKTIVYQDYQNLFAPVRETKTITKNQGKESAWLVLGWQTDGLENRKERAAIRVINAILGSGMSSRLFSRVRAEKGLAYAVASAPSLNINKGVFMIYIGTEPSKVNDAEAAILKEVERLQKEFVTDKELDDAKNKIKGSAVIGAETNSGKANYISTSEVNGSGYDYFFDKFNEDIDSVTVTDVINAANKYFSRPYLVSKVVPRN
ncbi:MAG: insulinase family protein [Candidatus Gastranaerophilales bacterium]|nr:insulinase family protein [Candidatus Gastranaerophilales bacterium]